MFGKNKNAVDNGEIDIAHIICKNAGLPLGFDIEMFGSSSYMGYELVLSECGWYNPETDYLVYLDAIIAQDNQ